MKFGVAYPNVYIKMYGTYMVPKALKIEPCFNIDMSRCILYFVQVHAIIDHGKFNNFKFYKQINFLKKNLLVLSMWKLTIG